MRPISLKLLSGNIALTSVLFKAQNAIYGDAGCLVCVVVANLFGIRFKEERGGLQEEEEEDDDDEEEEEVVWVVGTVAAAELNSTAFVS